MIKKPMDYDKVELSDFEFTPLALGGHRLVIKTAEEYMSMSSGNTSLKITVDTDKTDKQPAYFLDQYNNDTRAERKWANGATKYVSLGETENAIKSLKGFITAVENSNPNFKYDWDKDLSQLVGKRVGGIFGLEEYINNEGKTKLTTKLTQFRSVDKVDEAKIPKVAVLDGKNEAGYDKFKYVEYEDYMNAPKQNSVEKTFGEFVNVNEIEL